MRFVPRKGLEPLELEDGLRLGDLAVRAGMTTQSMDEFVDDLEGKGYLERRPDPDDRRAKRIYLTDRGRENARVAKQATADVEASLAALLGGRAVPKPTTHTHGHHRSSSR